MENDKRKNFGKGLIAAAGASFVAAAVTSNAAAAVIGVACLIFGVRDVIKSKHE